MQTNMDVTLVSAKEAITPPLALRPRDAARALGLSERTLFTLTKAGAVPHLRVGTAVLYPVESLRQWLSKQVQKTRAVHA